MSVHSRRTIRVKSSSQMKSNQWQIGEVGGGGEEEVEKMVIGREGHFSIATWL